MHFESDPKRQSAIIVFIIFALIFAAYAILVKNAIVFADDAGITQKTDASMEIVDAGVETATDAGKHDVVVKYNHDLNFADGGNDDPIEGLLGIAPMPAPPAGKGFHETKNPYYKEGYDESAWRNHYEYNYYLWLEYVERTDEEKAYIELEKKQVHAQIFEAVKQQMIHCVRRKDNVPVLNPSCRYARGGCEARINALVKYIVDVSYDLYLDPWLMAAIAMHESTYNPYALGPVGERGFFQINPNTPLGKRTKFVRSRRYRNRCLKKIGNCQYEIAQAAAIHLYRDFKKCNEHPDRALTAYNTGRCQLKNGRIRKKYVNSIKEIKDSMHAMSKKVNWCDGKSVKKVEIDMNLIFTCM